MAEMTKAEAEEILLQIEEEMDGVTNFHAIFSAVSQFWHAHGFLEGYAARQKEFKEAVRELRKRALKTMHPYVEASAMEDLEEIIISTAKLVEEK